MTALERRPQFDSTSAAGSMLVRQVGAPILVGCMLAGFGTSTAYAFPPDQVIRSQHPVEQTTAGRSIIVHRRGARRCGNRRIAQA